ncbi:MAG TPA: hypothetical protein VF082_12765 [Jiangellaceae bacterium]
MVSKTLGHSSIALTSNTYGHLLAGVGKAASEAAAALVPRNRRDQLVTNEVQEEEGEAMQEEAPQQVSDGGPPGTRTPNLWIKSRPSSVPHGDAT